MTARALGGLLAYNLCILGLGAGLLWGIRGWRWWTDFARLAGVAYLLGGSALMLLVMYEIVLGVPVTGLTLLVSGAGVALAGVAVGRLRGFTAPGIRPPGWRIPTVSLFASVFVAGIVVYFEALFRAERLAGVAREWDSWANWLPKSKWLYLTGRFDLDFLAGVPQLLSYPPGPAAIQTGAFHAMGSADTTTLHVHYWFMSAGFIAAVVGLLWRRVHHAILFPLVLMLLVAPSVVDWITTVYADLPMGYLLAVASILLVLWIEDRQPWQLAAASLLVAGAMVTKREGTIFAACVLLAALVASVVDRHVLWRRLLAASAVALALALPWTVWFVAHGAPAAAAYDTRYSGLIGDFDRLWPAFEITVRSSFHSGLWHFAPIVSVAALVLAAVAGAWRSAVFAGALLVSCIAAVTWMLWVNGSLVLDHDEWAIRRFVGTTFLAAAVLTPLLLERAWRSSEAAATRSSVRRALDVLFEPSRLGWIVVLVGLLSHPASILVGYSGSGLPGGWSSFPSCVVAPSAAAPVRVVVGYADTHVEARSLRDRALRAGLNDAVVAQDGCGRLRVYVDDVPTMDAADALVAEARAAGLRPTVERDQDD